MPKCLLLPYLMDWMGKSHRRVERTSGIVASTGMCYNYCIYYLALCRGMVSLKKKSCLVLESEVENKRLFDLTCTYFISGGRYLYAYIFQCFYPTLSLLVSCQSFSEEQRTVYRPHKNGPRTLSPY